MDHCPKVSLVVPDTISLTNPELLHNALIYHLHNVPRMRHISRLTSVLSVYTGSGDATARAYESKSGGVKRIFSGHQFGLNCLQVSIDHHTCMYF